MCSADTELGADSLSTATLRQAFLSRQRLLLANVEDICDAFGHQLSSVIIHDLSIKSIQLTIGYKHAEN